MGKHVQNGALSEFRNRILTQQNEIALRLNQEQVARSISELEDSAHLICNLRTVPKQLNVSTYLNQSSRSGHQKNSETWIRSLNQDLQKFTNTLPTHQRLAVATGIAAFVHKHGNQFGSLVKPLIQSISTLFRHLQHESETQMSLLQFISFSNIFARISEKTVQTNRLLMFGQSSSNSILSELIGKNETKQLMAIVQGSFLNQYSKFTQDRILQRMVNHADFYVTQNNSKNDACEHFPDSCLCSYRKVKINFPLLQKQRYCMKKQNDYNFKWENSTVLADGRNAIAITRQMNSDGAWGGLVKLLRPPVIQLNNGVRAFLVSSQSVMFPDGLHEKVLIECFLSNTMRKNSSYLSIPAQSVLRLTIGCNYTSNQIKVMYPIMTTKAKYHNTEIDQIKNFSVLHFNHKIDKRILNMMEQRFSESLLNEDLLQMRINEIASQSWLQTFFLKWVDYTLPYLLPAGAVILILILVPTVLYFNCCCCGCKRGKCRSSTISVKNQEPHLADLENRVSKLETFFEFFIQDRYHQISEGDVRTKIENKKASKEE